MIAAIQMKIQKLQSRTSPKLLMLLVPIVVSHLSGGGVVVMVGLVVLGVQEAHRVATALRQPAARLSMQTVMARISASFCPGATSTP